MKALEAGRVALQCARSAMSGSEGLDARTAILAETGPLSLCLEAWRGEIVSRLVAVGRVVIWGRGGGNLSSKSCDSLDLGALAFGESKLESPSRALLATVGGDAPQGWPRSSGSIGCNRLRLQHGARSARRRDREAIAQVAASSEAEQPSP